MPTWRLRDFHDDDLDRAIQIWDQDRQTDDMPPVFPVSEAMAEARTGGTAVVAVVGEDLVGMAVAQAQGERAWITLVALARMWRNRGIGSALIAEIERRLRTQGVRRIGALLVPGTTGTTALENSGYRTRDGLTFYEKVEHLGASDAGLLAELGGRMLPQGLWGALAGMEREKEAIERRIVLPLAEPVLADRYGVTPPKAVILFGPPGTGKTSFAKAVASRLAWPFVELFPPGSQRVLPADWPPHCGTRSPIWRSWNPSCCSSTKSRRSLASGPVRPSIQATESPTNCSS